jgi:isocitrate dehydrogenase
LIVARWAARATDVNISTLNVTNFLCFLARIECAASPLSRKKFMSNSLVVIKGDGIGPEIMDATIRVLDALQCGFNYQFVEAGLAAQQSTGQLLPAQTLEAIGHHRLCLKGPLTTPIGEA